MHSSFFTRSRVSPRTNRKSSFVNAQTLLSLMLSLSLACAARTEAGARCPAIDMSGVVASSDITGATASRDGDQWAVDVTVTDDAAKRVQEFTRQNVGRSMTIVVDGKVHGTPRIAGAVTANKYRIEGFTRDEAERLVTTLSNGCRR